MSVTLKDFAALAGSNNSIGYVTMNKSGTLEKAANHLHLTSLNAVPSDSKVSRQVREALLNAIASAMVDKVGSDRGSEFIGSVAHHLGLDVFDSDIAKTPLDRRTVRALVRATAEFGFGVGGKVEKATAGGKALAAFLGGGQDGAKVSTDVLVGLKNGVETLFSDDVDDTWVAGEKPGESFHLQKGKDNSVTVDCGGGVKVTLSAEALTEMTHLALVGRGDLENAELKGLLTDAGKRLAGITDLKELSGDSSSSVQFVRQLSEKALLAKLGNGAGGLTANELRNVPPRTMLFLARHVAEGNMNADDVRLYILLATADRFNAEETLQLLDMYGKAENKKSVGYADERIAEAKKQAEAKEAAERAAKLGPAASAKTKAWGGVFAKFLGKVGMAVNAKRDVQAMLADVISDKRSFLADQHPEPGGRLRVSLQSHTKTLALVLCNRKTFEDSVPAAGAAFLNPLAGALQELLEGSDESVTVEGGEEEKVENALNRILAGNGATAKLATLERDIDKASAALCTKMQYKLNHSFAKVFDSSGGPADATDRYDELLDLVFDKSDSDSATTEEKDALIDKSDFTSATTEEKDALIDKSDFTSATTEEKDALIGKIDAFVDSFAKVGWTKNALNHVIDDAITGATNIKDAEQKLNALVIRYAGFAEVAQRDPKHFVAPDHESVRALESRLDELHASPEDIGAIFSSLAKFVAIGKMDVCCNIVLECFGSSQDPVANIKDFLNRIQPLEAFAANLTELSRSSGTGGEDDMSAQVSLMFTRLAIGETKGEKIQGTALETLKNALSAVGEACEKLRDRKSVADGFNLLLQYVSTSREDVRIKVKGALDRCLTTVRAELANPEKLRTAEPELKTGVQNLVDFAKANGLESEDLHPETKKPDDTLKALRLKRSRDLLEKLGGVDDMDKGYGLFMTKVMKEYVKSMSVADQRAMLAAGVRFADADASEMKQMGAFLKGAGPIMQKMLQGFASMDVDKDFLDALADMKSNLPDIADDVVKANLLDMVNRSNGKITDIEMTKKLGAASVGQAFLCTVKKSDGTKQDVVVKMLRPEAEQRADREKELFIRLSKEVPGMETTFAGQLASIMDELDLRKEAENTQAGAVYDKGGMDVKSMKLLDVIAPTKYTMVVEKAPGTTVDRLIADTEKKIEALTDAFFKTEPKKDKDGKEVKGDDGKTVMVRVPNKDAFKTNGVRNMVDFTKAVGESVLGLSQLYEETLVQQKRIVSLASKWTLEGVFGKGFYHGDLHAGNIMVDTQFARDKDGRLDTSKNGGLTVIDFGNATHLTGAQQKNVIKMMTAANTKDTNVFLKNFCALMTPEGQVAFKADWNANHDLVHNIFNLGTASDAATRISAALQQLQLKGYELPGPIFRFSQCSIRLQGTIQQLNDLLGKIKLATLGFRDGVTFNFKDTHAKLRPMDQLGGLMNDLFNGATDKFGSNRCDFEKLQKVVDGKLASLDAEPGKSHPKESVSDRTPSQILKEFFADPIHLITADKECERLMAPLAGLKNSHPDVHQKLEEANAAVVESLMGGNSKLVKDIKQLLGGQEGATMYFNRVALNKRVAIAKKTWDYLHTDSGKKLLKKFLGIIGGYKNRDYDDGALRKKIADLLEFNLRDADVRGFLKNNVESLLACGTDDSVSGQKVERPLEVFSCRVDELLEQNQAISPIYKGNDEEAQSRFEQLDKKFAELDKNKAGLLENLGGFGDAYAEAQKVLLEDFKKQIEPICHKNKKGQVDARMVPDGELDDFSDAVGQVIGDNVISSAWKTGLGVAIEAVWKTAIRSEQAPTL